MGTPVCACHALALAPAVQGHLFTPALCPGALTQWHRHAISHACGVAVLPHHGTLVNVCVSSGFYHSQALEWAHLFTCLPRPRVTAWWCRNACWQTRHVPTLPCCDAGTPVLHICYIPLPTCIHRHPHSGTCHAPMPICDGMTLLVMHLPFNQAANIK